MLTDSFAKGSPPQVRGKPAQRDSLGSCARITPAGAGKTVSGNTMSDIFTHHPRRCGENGLNLQTCHHMIGSPPQVRGKQIALLVGRGSPWITPAGAGKTCYHRAGCASIQDHPRRCGENATRTDRQRMSPGSPPRMRGKPQTDRYVFRRQGITPAGAGKTNLNS